MDKRRSRGAEEAHASSHRLWLILSTGALAAAVVVGLFECWSLSFRLGDLPTMCAFKRTTGIPCPGCGLTRSWAALGRGALSESLSFHRLGWAVMLFVALQAVRHAAWLAAASARTVIDRWGRWLDRSLVVLAVAMFINWGFALAGR